MFTGLLVIPASLTTMTTLEITPAFHFTPTQDWFSHNIENWRTLFPLIQSSQPRVLEIGSWEGRSTVFLLTELCKDGGEIVCIDHFDLFQSDAGQARFTKISHNLALTGKKHRVIPQFSFPALMTVLEEEMSVTPPGFDWIYVDGSHEADDTFLDGELVWRLARKGAIVIFDDYHWDKEPEDSMHHPKRGIDAFLTLHRGEYEKLTEDSHYQVVLRKTIEMRIGFLIPDKVEGKMDEGFGYGVHIALTTDASYAMGAAVTIRSAVENTPGRITVYIVDLGLPSADREKLRASIPARDDVTLMFLSLPEQSLAREMGATWVKLDLHQLLPVERVLYLDADILVRYSLKALWDTDLGMYPLAAAYDVGHPMGHDEIVRKPYFNAGVLLLDLEKVRQRKSELKELAEAMREAKFRDQDALNAFFPDWKQVGLEWNAQGLGTYANYPSPDRDLLRLEKMDKPKIVHFTGPVHPTLVEVLNPYVQPPTAKPWGYLGSPGHTFEGEWWAVLEKTAWKGFKISDERKRINTDEIEKSIGRAADEFRGVVGKRT